MRERVLVFIFVATATVATGQKYSVEKSNIVFFSHAAIEDITAENKKSAGIFNSATGDLVFSIPMTEFQFAKSLMKEHFNEKYIESDKFPKATFKGNVTGYDAAASGAKDAKATGKLSMHGVEKDVEIPGTIEKQGDKLLFKAKFIVKLEDYKIAIPTLLFQNIAEQVEVTADFVFKPQ